MEGYEEYQERIAWVAEVEMLRAQLTASQDRERVLRKALGKYADEKNWRKFYGAIDDIWSWDGEDENPRVLAQQVLNQTKEGDS
jgi:hypothetical protein